MNLAVHKNETVISENVFKPWYVQYIFLQYISKYIIDSKLFYIIQYGYI